MIVRHSTIYTFLSSIDNPPSNTVLRQAASKLPTKMEFINRATPPRLGNLVLHPPKPVLMDPIAIPGSSTTDSTTLPLSS